MYLPPSANFDDLQVSVGGAPAESESPEDFGMEDSRQWIAYDLILNVNQTANVTFLYDGPFATVSSNGSLTYQIAWEKQINALTWPMSVEVDLPGGKRFSFHSNLSTDQAWQASGS